MEILNVENLTFTYPEAEAPSVREVSFSLAPGEFAVLAGATGSGKSTLLRLLKREIAPLGARSGSVFFRGVPAEEMTPAASAAAVGFVMQDPERQIVTDKVWHELAFGLENLGVPPKEIARRVAEMAAYFGLEPLYEKETASLSGGQKQLLNLAAVMVMRPDVLILDEPTAQMDPITASDFIAALRRLNRDFALTVLVAEHRLEELIPAADRLIVMEQGRILENGDPRTVTAKIGRDSPLFAAMPSAVRLYHALGGKGECPLTVREGRQYLSDRVRGDLHPLPEPTAPEGRDALRLREVFFRYGKSAPDVLRGTDLTVREGEIYCLLGGNGAGKSTALKAAAGLIRPYAGSVEVFGRRICKPAEPWLYQSCVAYLPQDVQTAFLCSTVREELADAWGKELPRDLPFDLTPLLGRHPYDLSGGEQQLLALTKALAARPRLLLLDEPTKGLDAARKARLTAILQQLRAAGTTVLAVTHDVEFAALAADRCGLFFHGGVVSEGAPRAFFCENHFYTTAVSRMARGILPGAVTVTDAVRMLSREEDRDARD